jgi:hypothetical protein
MTYILQPHPARVQRDPVPLRPCPLRLLTLSLSFQIWGRLQRHQSGHQIRQSDIATDPHCHLVQTLSVSIVTTSSSARTVSPTCFDQDLSVPSVMDSAICGTLIVSAEFRYCDLKCVLKSLKKERYPIKGERSGNALP